jgi:hypothetical protein
MAELVVYSVIILNWNAQNRLLKRNWNQQVQKRVSVNKITNLKLQYLPTN